MKIKMFFLIECSIILGGIFIYSVFGYKDTDNVIKTVRINNNSNNSSIESNVIITKDDIYIPMKDLSNVLEKGMLFDEGKNLIRISEGAGMSWFDYVDIFNDNKELFYDAVTLLKKNIYCEERTQSLNIYFFNIEGTNGIEFIKDEDTKDIMLKLNNECHIQKISLDYSNEDYVNIEFFFEDGPIEGTLTHGFMYTTIPKDISRDIYYKIKGEEEWYMFFYPYV